MRSVAQRSEPLQAHKLRGCATTWRGIPEPPIRVTKKNPTKLRSYWLFAEEDCWAYAREHGKVGPRAHTDRDPDIDPDDPDAIADAYLERVSL